MTRRFAVVACALAAAFALVPAGSASAVGCLPGFSQRPSGLYHPLTGNPIMVCQLDPPPSS